MLYEGTEYFFNKNILGDVIGVYSSSGTYVGGYTYDAWGNITSQTNHPAVNANPFRYRGYYYDQETGLYYLNSRYYDPETGRFINADEPTMLYSTASTFGGVNLYSYCYNNPISNTDPNGDIALVDDLAYLLIFLFFVGAVVYVESEYHLIENMIKEIAVLTEGAVNAATQWLTSIWHNGQGYDRNLGTIPWEIEGAIDKYTFASNERPRDNKKQNEQFKSVMRELKIKRTDPRWEKGHRAMEGKNFGYKGLYEFIKKLFGL